MIQASYGEPKKLSCLQSCFLQFEYKPQIVDTIRTIPDRFYNAKDKIWEVPTDSIPVLKQALVGEKWKFTGRAATRKSMLDKTPKFHYEPPKEMKTEMYNFQKEDFNILMNHDKYLVLSEIGTGKSITTISVALKRKEVNKIKRCLVIACVASLKFNWVNEIQEHSNATVKVLGGDKSSISSQDKLNHLNNLDDTFFIVTNIETLRNKEILEKLKKLIRSGEIEMLICDEAHKSSNPSSQQGKGLLAICKYLKYIYLLSGTPLTNSPVNAYLPLKCVNGEKTNFTQYRGRYCVYGGFGGYQIVGYRNLKELQIKIDLLSIRRLKKDVMELPPQIFIDEVLEMGNDQRRVYENVKKAILADLNPDMLALDPMTVMLRARQATAFTSIVSPTVDESVKLERLKELVEEADSKVVVFSNWTTVTNILEKHFDNYAIVTGNVKDREAQIKKFKEDDNCKVIIGTIGALGTGFTLTEATTAIFFDQPWNFASFTQAAGRIYRIGTKGSVNIISLICKNTIDEFVSRTIKKKRMLGDAIIDKRFSVQDEKILSFMMDGIGDFYS